MSPTTLGSMEKTRVATTVRLNLGCGAIRPAGWVNTDSSLNTQLQRLPVIGRCLTRALGLVEYGTSNVRFVDLNRPWPFGNGEVVTVYCSHAYEHLDRAAAELFLREAWRCLAPGGVLRLVVPDFQAICRQYLWELESGDAQASVRALDAINMHREGQYSASAGIIHRLLAAWQGYPHQHKYMYDEPALRARLVATGFVDVRTSSYGKSAYIREIRDVEGAAVEPYASVYLEARRPVAPSPTASDSGGSHA